MIKEVKLISISADQLDEMTDMLKANELPTQDIADKLPYFYFCSSEDKTVGLGGVELCGRYGLLRSIVISPDQRGNGFGVSLVQALEQKARGWGVKNMYLLTTTAREFFLRRGYRPIRRDTVPPKIQDTTEFAELCPDTAVCMHKELF